LPGAAYWILYDGECRICAAIARWARAIDVRRRIRIRPIQDAADLLGPMASASALTAYHVVAPDGLVTTGGDAVPTMIEAFPAGSGLARFLRESPALMASVRRAYRFATRFRDVLLCRVPAAAGSADPCP